jgi:hypothetical protein
MRRRRNEPTKRTDRRTKRSVAEASARPVPWREEIFAIRFRRARLLLPAGCARLPSCCPSLTLLLLPLSLLARLPLILPQSPCFVQFRIHPSVRPSVAVLAASRPPFPGPVVRRIRRCRRRRRRRCRRRRPERDKMHCPISIATSVSQCLRVTVELRSGEIPRAAAVRAAASTAAQAQQHP